MAPSFKAGARSLRLFPSSTLQIWNKPGTRGEPNTWCESKPRYFRRSQDLVEGVCDHQGKACGVSEGEQVWGVSQCLGL